MTHTMHRLLKHLLIGMVSLALLIPSAWAKTTASPSPPPIRVITNNWTSQIVLAHIAAALFRKQDYAVEFVQTPVSAQWGALSHGVAHVQVEVWEGTMADVFDRMVNEGLIVDAGTHNAKTREDWWYPAYVEALCPGLPDWHALNACANLFALGTDRQGTYFAGPWEKPDEARIRALGMQFKVNMLAKGDDLWVELEKAVQTNRPIVLFNWTPNWVESVYPGKFVEFPTHQIACETDPQWGLNKTYTYDCGNPKDGWLKKAASRNFQTGWPCAYQVLANMNFDNAQLARAAALVDVEGLSYEEAARRWMAEYAALWADWLPKDCTP